MAGKSSAALTTQTKSGAAQPALQSEALQDRRQHEPNDEGNMKRSKTSAEQPVHLVKLVVKLAHDCRYAVSQADLGRLALGL